MAKILNTRIQLRYDNYVNWMKSRVALLQGEVALCFIPAHTPDFNNEQSLVMHKIGSDQGLSFKDLPWGSASALLDEKGNNILATYATKEELQAQAQEYVIVETLVDRNNIPLEDRIVGMRVYVHEKDSLYTWNGVSWTQSFLDPENLLAYFDPAYFKTTEGSQLLTIDADTVVMQGSNKLVTSGAVYTHVENTVGVIETALRKI